MENYVKGRNVTIKEHCVIGKNVIIEDNVYIDYNCIIRDNVMIKKNTTIGANCIIGEYLADWFEDHEYHVHPLIIGENSIIRSGSIIYGGSTIGDYFQCGHQVTIREKTVIGNHCSIGTLSDIQGDCVIGDYTRCHSNVHIGMKSQIGKYVWIYPYVVLTNDPTPPSTTLLGSVIDDFAVISTGSLIMPGIHIHSDSLVSAGAVVTKDVMENQVIGGVPGKVISTTDKIKNRNTWENVYPWRYSFERNMPWEGIGYENWRLGKNTI